MIEKKKGKNIFLKIIYSQVFLSILGLAIIILISVPLAKNLSKRYYVDQEIKDIEQEIETLELKNKDLGKLISYLESEQYVEEQARLNLGLKKKGEEVVVIKELEKVTETELNIDNSISNSKNINSNPERWLSYFFE